MTNSELNIIYNNYKTLVYNLALNYVQNIEDAEEITQDVFVQIYHSLEKFKNNSPDLSTLFFIFS